MYLDPYNTKGTINLPTISHKSDRNIVSLKARSFNKDLSYIKATFSEAPNDLFLSGGSLIDVSTAFIPAVTRK